MPDTVLEVVLAVYERDLNLPIKRCGYGLREAINLGLLRRYPTGPLAITTAGREYLRLAGLL